MTLIGNTSLSTRSQYGSIANVYDCLSHLYSFGAIRRTKIRQLKRLRSAERLLVAGAGTGVEAAMALTRGVRTTVVEESKPMMDLARDRLSKWDKPELLDLHHKNIMDFEAPDAFDAVSANYFLNVFGPEEVPLILNHLVRQMRPRGVLAVADLAPSTGGGIGGLFQECYYRLALEVFVRLTGNARHRLYDYGVMVESYHLPLFLLGVEDIRLFPGGPAWFRNWYFEKRL
ncbi:MAG: methyltransferase domain-containing protein [Myxococcota bacterium]|nr:methyltransferase domain-containing protein [Myxococcota bacterium]